MQSQRLTSRCCVRRHWKLCATAVSVPCTDISPRLRPPANNVVVTIRTLEEPEHAIQNRSARVRSPLRSLLDVSGIPWQTQIAKLMDVAGQAKSCGRGMSSRGTSRQREEHLCWCHSSASWAIGAQPWPLALFLPQLGVRHFMQLCAPSRTR